MKKTYKVSPEERAKWDAAVQRIHDEREQRMQFRHNREEVLKQFLAMPLTAEQKERMFRLGCMTFISDTRMNLTDSIEEMLKKVAARL